MKRSFTLIELLVVVAIIAILAALLMPALTKARNHASAILCLSNQKQIGIGMISYVNNHNDLIPRQRKSPDTGADSGRHAGFVYAVNYELTGKSPIDGVKNYAKIFLCPRAPYKSYDKSYAAITSAGQGYHTYRSFSFYSAIKHPTKKAALWDGPYHTELQGVAVSLGNVAYYMPGAGRYGVTEGSGSGNFGTDQIGRSDFINGRHGLNVNLLYFDGHAATVPVKGDIVYFYHFTGTGGTGNMFNRHIP